jgi:hypothetical protein
MVTRMTARMSARSLLLLGRIAVALSLLAGFVPRHARAADADADHAGAPVAAAPAVPATTAPAPAAPAPTASPCPVDFKAPFVDGQAGWHEEPVPAPQKIAWEQALGGTDAARPQVRARLRALPDRVLAADRTLPADDHALLERVARDTWRGIDALTDRDNGLPVDNVRLLPPDASAPAPDAAPSDVRVGDYTNVTNVGMHLASIVAARELGLITAEQARERIGRILDTLDRLEAHAGFLYNFYDTTSLERTSNFLSFVDLAWLATGLIVVRQADPQLAARAGAMLERMDFGFFYDRDLGLISHGHYAHKGVKSRYHYGVLYTEARLGALLAIGKGDVPEAAWFKMARIFPQSCEGQTLEPRDVRLAITRGYETWLGNYEWQGVRYVPSWGGSMFEALMPTLVLDEPRLAPNSLGANDRAHARVQQAFATRELGYDVWGLSPSATPEGLGYQEYGVRVLGTRGYRGGAVTPHAAALALAVAPDAAIAALRRLAAEYPVYGEYGFYDAVDPVRKEVAYTYLALDQSMLFLAVANQLSGGSVQRLFASDPIIARVLPLLGAESWFAPSVATAHAQTTADDAAPTAARDPGAR